MAWSAGGTLLSLTGFKDTHYCLFFFKKIAEFGFLAPTNAVLATVTMTCGYLPFLICMQFCLLFAENKYDIWSMVEDYWSGIIMLHLVLDNPTLVLKICKQVRFFYNCAVLFVILLPMSICTLENSSFSGQFSFLKLPNPNSFVRLWASNAHMTCLEDMSKPSSPSMSALAIVASFQPALYVAMLMFCIILLLQMFVCITANPSSASTSPVTDPVTDTETTVTGTTTPESSPETTTEPESTSVGMFIKSSVHEMAQEILEAGWHIIDTWVEFGKIIIKTVKESIQTIKSEVQKFYRDDFRKLVLLMLWPLMSIFHNMCFQVLTLGVHGLSDCTTVALYMGMLFLISCLQAHIENPGQKVQRKLLSAVFGKMLCPRNFCPIASTPFMRAPQNMEVQKDLGFQLLEDNSKNVLVCAGLLPGTCTDQTDINTWFLWAVNVCVFMSFMIHVRGRRVKQDKLDNKIEVLENTYFCVLLVDRWVKYM